MSTRPRDPLAASVASTSPRYWSRVLQTDQAFHRDTVARRQAGALDEWRIDHLADPASSHARQALFDLCRDDPTRSLHALRASQPTRDSPLQKPILHTSAAVFPRPRPPVQIPRAQIRQRPVPGIWPEDEILNAARWIFQYPRCPWPQADPHPIFHRQPLGYGGSQRPRP